MTARLSSEIARKNAVLDELCQDLGRRPGDLARATGGTVTLSTTQRRQRLVGENDVQGTPEEVLSQLLAYRDAGAGEFIVCDDAANVPAEQALNQIDILTQAVLPRLT
jgi:alkanesulfonate monooxygenase SsuD/methylene tetrahydromethanopterin reductase-like flavin-dependent oxidoreductase (luciferase family)